MFLESDAGLFVLRFGAHYDWQFPTEQFFCNLIHERTRIPVPWPYQWDQSSDVFGYPWGYVLMPRLPGITTADPKVYEALSPADKRGIARALGQSLREVHGSVRHEYAGAFDHRSRTIEPFAVPYTERVIERIAINAEAAASNGALTTSEREWLDAEVQQLRVRDDAFEPRLVHADFNTNNSAFEHTTDGWRLSGLFDLMEAHFGDPLADVPRQFNMYVADDASFAEVFLTSYLETRPQTAALSRLRLYHLDERLIVWEFFHRPDYIHLWRDSRDIAFREWYLRYRSALDDALKLVG